MKNTQNNQNNQNMQNKQKQANKDCKNCKNCGKSNDYSRGGNNDWCLPKELNAYLPPRKRL